MLDKLEEILVLQCELDKSKPILIGLSGGPDSLGMLDALRQLGYKIIAAHLNHKLRPESDAEAEHVEKIAGSMGVPFFLSVIDVFDFAREHRLSVEEAGREVRYKFLFRTAGSEDAQAVAVGHNADDQVETVLMHFLRGAGLGGLRGMTYRMLPNAWSDHIPLVRPMLDIWREEILDYCRDRKLTPVTDMSNLDQTYFRNRLRHDLVPHLESYNPKVKQNIYRTADVVREDFEIISEIVDSAWKKCLHSQGPGYLGLQIECLKEQRLGILRHIIRRAIAYHCPDLRDIDYKTIDSFVSFVEQPTSTRQRDLISGLKLSLEEDILWITRWDTSLPEAGWPAVSWGEALSLRVPGKIPLGNSWELSAGIFPATQAIREQALANMDPYQAWIDEDHLSAPLQIRSRQPGDRFHPQGMEGHSIKLSDFMINVKIPGRARDHWPLICSNDEIIWVPGYRIHDAYRITDTTKKLLHLILTQARS